jgi:3-deoxy-D-manno-octulosonic-acid transferase
VTRRKPGDCASWRTGALRIALDGIYFLATPFVFLAFLVRSRCFARRRYRAGFREKLGGVPRREGDRPCIWIHAVSVGELRAAIPLVEALLRDLPGWDIRISTFTDTGQDLARGLPPEVRPFYYPFDYGFAVRRSLARIRPTGVVLLELELWPNFLLAAREAGVPVLVANGRISARSFPRYRRLGAATRLLFGGVTAVAAQNEEYARRFQALGVPADCVEVLGNLKYDAVPREAGDPAATKALLGWKGDDRVLVGGCTHASEEDQLLAAWEVLRGGFPDLKLVLAPRHIERAGEVRALCEGRGAAPAAWSKVAEGRPAGPRDVLVVDRIGELDRFYAIGDAVFVGGSLVPRGGHNMLEPARLGRPVLFGPSVSNFEDVAAHLLSREAAVEVDGPGGLVAEVRRVLADRGLREKLGGRAREAAEELRGATARHVEWIRKKLASV